MKEIEVFAKVKIHNGAILAARKWHCVCGFDLGLPQESLGKPTQEQIIDRWAQHLTTRLVSLEAHGR